MKRPIDAMTLKEEFTGNINDGYYTVAEIKAIIDAAPTLNVPGKWISVEDRMPDKSGPYLVRFKNVFGERLAIKVYYWNAKIGYWRGAEAHSMIIGITHWMPLPEPPKENGDG